MSAMIYYTELLYLFLYLCWFFVAITCLIIASIAVSWCIKKIKEYKK